MRVIPRSLQIHRLSKSEDDGCGESDGGGEGRGATVKVCGDPAPVPQSSELEFDLIAPLLSAPVVADGIAV